MRTSAPVRLRATVCASLFALLGAVGVAADGEWTVRIDRDGLQVATRDVPRSDFKAFRATVRVAALPDAVLARLRDVERYPGWFPDTREARVVERADGRWASYVRTGAPWPVKDRDAVYVSTLEGTADAYRVKVSVAPSLVPEVDDAVRIRQAEGYWHLERDGDGTLITWEFHVEPGGSVPGSLANARVVATPRDALSALREYFGGTGAPD
jgi:hypothetical protein